MARNLDPKCKLCRREGAKLFLKGEKCFSPNCAMVKRDYAPGMHGAAAKRKRLSSFGLQLREKQKAKRFYQLLEKQFYNYYERANSLPGDVSEILPQLLERRLDNVVYRLGLAAARTAARQLVNHGHIMVNGAKVTIPSYQVKIGDEIGVKEAYLKKPFWISQEANLGKSNVPGWLNFDLQKKSGKVVSLPRKEDFSEPFDVTLIIEFYSR